MTALVGWCLRRRSVVVLASLLILGIGAFGATQLRQQYFPEVDFPFAVTTITVQGLDAEQVDDQVAVPLEQAVSDLEEVKSTQTVANDGRVTLVTELAYGTDTEGFQEDLAREIAGVPLPDEAGEPDIGGGFDDQAALNAALSTNGSLTTLTERAEDLKTDLERIEGVGRVDLEGGAQREFEVELRKGAVRDGQTPAALGAEIQGALESRPIGIVEREGSSTPLRIDPSEVTSRKDLEDVPITGGRTVSDVAVVRRATAQETGLARTNGRDSVALSVFPEQDADEVAVVDAAQKRLDEAKSVFGADNVETIFETASDVKSSVNGLLLEGALGALFAVLVIFLFLRSLRATVVAAVSIPTSIVFGLLAAWGLGLTLNIITLAGLTIAIGRVIDDAIVVLENVYKHLERGEPRAQSALQGTAEVANAIVSSTLATAAVFLPLGLVGGLISEIFFSFSIIVVIALLASLLVAVTVIPVLAVTFLRPRAQKREGGGGLGRLVTPLTRFGIRPFGRVLVILAAFVALAAALGGVAGGAVPVQFLPDSGTQQAFGSVELPAGASDDRARRLLRPLEDRLRSIDGIRTAQVTAGGAGLQTDEVEDTQSGQFFATFDEGVDVERVTNQLRAFGERAYPAGFTAQRLEQGPPAGAFQATVIGDSQAEVERAARRVTDELEKRSDITEIDDESADTQSQFVVSLDKDARGGEDEARALQALSSVVPPAEAGSVGPDDIPVTVRAPADLLSDADALEDVPLAPAAAAAAGGGAQAAAGGGGAAPPGADGGGGPARAAAGGQPPPGGAAGGEAPAAGGGAGAAGSPGPAGAAGATGAAAAAGGQARPARLETIGDVGKVRREPQPSSRSRVDGEIATQISARVLGEDVNATNQQITDRVEALKLQGARVELGGDAEFIEQMFTDLTLAMAAAIILVFLVLVVFFGSIGQPITILAPVLFSTIGSLLALIITGSALGLPAMIGQLLLIGIVVANSILLVDTALRMRRSGSSRDAALIGAARLRVRPVLMTAVATIAALLPLALGLSGEGGIISKSLGAVVIGGLITATVLTLVIVPAVFSLFDGLGVFFGRLFGRGESSELAMAGIGNGAGGATAPARGAPEGDGGSRGVPGPLHASEERARATAGNGSGTPERTQDGAPPSGDGAPPPQREERPAAPPEDNGAPRDREGPPAAPPSAGNGADAPAGNGREEPPQSLRRGGLLERLRPRRRS